MPYPLSAKFSLSPSRRAQLFTSSDQHGRRLVGDVRTLINDRPSGAYLLKMENAELETGHLGANIRNTRAN
jgi:hypothetical protein